MFFICLSTLFDDFSQPPLCDGICVETAIAVPTTVEEESVDENIKAVYKV
jgi:hypothetical protein